MGSNRKKKLCFLLFLTLYVRAGPGLRLVSGLGEKAECALPQSKSLKTRASRPKHSHPGAQVGLSDFPKTVVTHCIWVSFPSPAAFSHTALLFPFSLLLLSLIPFSVFSSSCISLYPILAPTFPLSHSLSAHRLLNRVGTQCGQRAGGKRFN